MLAFVVSSLVGGATIRYKEAMSGHSPPGPDVSGPRTPGPVVLAFGGNALLPEPFHPEEQEARARELARAVLLLLEEASGLVLVHGNGAVRTLSFSFTLK